MKPRNSTTALARRKPASSCLIDGGYPRISLIGAKAGVARISLELAAIGHILQCLAQRPYDLSRGCSTEDSRDRGVGSQ
ncbi:hypothetical protein [Mesorhizobium sp. B2-6-5]|uniref:hypothetical protein n=1 Tax=Mesorhizobium sp. B2-6-5 TaxID=2589912 RepID=UPI0011299E4C|nr:hypothetical protein [Mesorhizobium sp. B2-6-5]TPJ38551.1 hypothetical protein FJ432_22090 [Mesorhizobium sp. B2-6-5]